MVQRRARPSDADALAAAVVALMSPAELLALRHLLAHPDGVRPDDPRLAALGAEGGPLRGLLRLRQQRLTLARPNVRTALLAALDGRGTLSDPATEIRRHLSQGRTGGALAALATAGGAFAAMIHGLETARALVAQFPDASRQTSSMLVMADAVNALKSGNTAFADRLVAEYLGQQLPRDLGQDLARLDASLVCFCFVKAVYEDSTLGDSELRQLFALLSRLPPQADIERGLMYNVALDVFVRRRDWAGAEETALRALHHFQAAGAALLAFYILLYLAVIDLAQARIGAARQRLDQAQDTLDATARVDRNDRDLLARMSLVAAYEAGDPAPLLAHLLGDEEAAPEGELWPAMVSPLIAYGRRALAAHATHAAAIAWVRRWRVQHLRSHRFETLIVVNEARALQAARRWQEADEVMAAHERTASAVAIVHPDWQLARLASLFERQPKAPRVEAELKQLVDRGGLTARQQARIALLRAAAALARAATAEATNHLADLVTLAPPQQLPAFYVENRALIGALAVDRRLAPHLRRLPGLARTLKACLPQAAARETDAPTLTRQELRVLAMLGEGAANKTIALRLGLAVATVKFHLRNLMAKTGTRRRTEIVEEAARRGWFGR